MRPRLGMHARPHARHLQSRLQLRQLHCSACLRSTSSHKNQSLHFYLHMKISSTSFSHSTCPPLSSSPPHAQLYHRSWSNKHTHSTARTTAHKVTKLNLVTPVPTPNQTRAQIMVIHPSSSPIQHTIEQMVGNPWHREVRLGGALGAGAAGAGGCAWPRWPAAGPLVVFAGWVSACVAARRSL